MLTTNYAYLIGILIVFIVWVFLFLKRKNTRKEMWIMGIITAPLPPIMAHIFYQDYWEPNYLLSFFGVSFEEILFGFLIGGIAAVIYEVVFMKKFKKIPPTKSKTIIILCILFLFSLIIFKVFLDINSIYSSSIALLLFGTTIILIRKDLLKNAISSGILLLIMAFILYIIYIKIFPTIISDFWKLETLSGILIFEIPIEELLWFFSWGFFAGPLYEFWRGKKEKE